MYHTDSARLDRLAGLDKPRLCQTLASQMQTWCQIITRTNGCRYCHWLWGKYVDPASV